MVARVTLPDQPMVGVVVMAKEPRPGRVKTRLQPALTGVEASELYAAMLADRCAQVRALRGVVPAITFADGGGDGVAAAAGFERVAQPPGGLGVGLRAASEQFLGRGLPVVLVDSDSPSLPLDYLQRAVDWVREGACDVVIGPSDDGGYYLIGLARPAPELFEAMPWSTPEVVSTTLARAAERGLAVRTLPAWWDVDTAGDLDRLRDTLFATCWPEKTAAWLRARQRSSPASGEALPPPEQMWRQTWRTLSSRPVYATPWLRVREDTAITPAGVETSYSVVDCGACVGVLPFVDDETVLLVCQYRYVAARVTWEMPTGGVHAGEAPEHAARRELAEEAKVAARDLVSLGAYHTSKSVMDETAHLYAAYGLTPRALTADEDEFIRAEPVPFSRVLDWVLSGEIVDSMTIISVLRVAYERGLPAPALRGR